MCIVYVGKQKLRQADWRRGLGCMLRPTFKATKVRKRRLTDASSCQSLIRQLTVTVERVLRCRNSKRQQDFLTSVLYQP